MVGLLGGVFSFPVPRSLDGLAGNDHLGGAQQTIVQAVALLHFPEHRPGRVVRAGLLHDRLVPGGVKGLPLRLDPLQVMVHEHFQQILIDQFGPGEDAARVAAGSGRLQDAFEIVDHGQQIAPADGIYAGRAEVRGGSYPAAISVGSPPTFAAAPWSVEAFLLNAQGDFYDDTMGLSFIARLHDQVRYADVSALKAGIARDVQRVREICE